jgi:hypothetical protein
MMSSPMPELSVRAFFLHFTLGLRKLRCFRIPVDRKLGYAT